ncbi:MAG: hypothetical protein ABW252_11670 [Polyangiales bacterium]
MIRFFHALSFALVTFAAGQAFAGPPDDAKASLGKAREALVAMLDADAAKYDALTADIAKASKAVDAALAAGTADKAHADVYKDLKKTWDEFKKTRDGEIIPALKSGKKDAAKALAKGVQAERFKKLNELLASVGAK